MQCFVVSSDEIEGRLDAVYYKPEFAAIKTNLEKTHYPIKQIQDFAKVICGPFGSSIQVKDYQETGTPLVRIANIGNDQRFIKENIIFINESLAKKLQSYKVKKDDLVISQRGTLGLTAIIPDFFDGAIISANFIAIKELHGISTEFLKTFLNSTYGQIQLKQKTSGQVQTKITTDDIKKLLVPLPPLSIQNQIVDIMQSTYSQKKQKEAEAQRHLDSIDGFVLEELGIKLPEVEEKMCFVVNSEEVQSNRFDAYYRQPKFEEVEKAIKRGKFEVKNGEDLFVLIESGKGISPEQFTYKGIGFLEVKNIGFIGISLPEFYVQEDNKLKYVQKGDILTGRVGSIGSFALYDIEDNLAFSDNVLRIKCIASISNLYLTAILNSILVKIQIDRSKKGSLQNVINRLTLNDLKIPRPPLEIQNKIAEEVKRRISEAETLKAEASRIIEEAKKQVEKMILGD